ncbi:MAG TPA: hypothetical protein VGS41_01815 [Chthonomonadales bacterium]|nr:hypothetical protein [Chthonomonadales bacterium]
MEPYISRISTRLARLSSRRDFIAVVTRGVIGLGSGAAALFGGAVAGADDRDCKTMDGTRCDRSYCSQNANDYFPDSVCYKGALPLCVSDAGKDNCEHDYNPKTGEVRHACPRGYNDFTFWKCCCGAKGRVRYCYACQKKGDNLTSCLCKVNTQFAC